MLNLDSKVKDVLSNPQAVAIIEKYAPGVTTNPLIKLFSSKSVREVASSDKAKQMGMTPEIMGKLEEEFKKIK